MKIKEIDFWSLPSMDSMQIECEPIYDSMNCTPVRVVYNFTYTSSKNFELKTFMVRRVVWVNGAGSYNVAVQTVLKHFNPGTILGIYVHDKLVSPELLNGRF